VGQPSTQAVRLKWAPVPGATAYEIYRADRKPSTRADIGFPLAEIDSPGHVSYEDRFDLKAQTYFYSVVPKAGEEEAAAFATIEAQLPVSITLEDALKISETAQVGATLDLPSHPLGTDYLGRDLLARLMTGARVSLFIGIVAPFVWTLLGLLIGGIAGYFGGTIDNVLMRLTDFVLALPFVLFAILFRVSMGTASGESGIFPMILAMITLLWTSPARLVRGEILRLREAEFVQASRLLGARPHYLLLRHLLPNTMGVILVSLTFSIPYAIFTEAFLSFIGMGVVPPTPSWGSMCNDGIKTFLTHPHEFIFPAIFISLAVLAFNLLGDGLRDALDPRMRSVQ
jgi:oligopeptide transport system permease protein